MAEWAFPVIDCDGHLIDSIPEMAEFMDPAMRREILKPQRDREGAFPSLDGFHGPRIPGNGAAHGRPYVTSSDHRRGSGEDYLAFVAKAGLEQAVMFTSEGLSVGFIQEADYAVRICRAYNDYVHERYRRLSNRLYPMALIPFQDPRAAVLELRRAVRELDLPGAMVPSSGLPLHVGHDYYWPIYQEAADLDCALGLHGGSTKGLGIDSYSTFRATIGLHHSIPLLTGFASLIGHGVLERFPTLRIGFFEGGCAWLACLLDRMERDEEVTGRVTAGPLQRCLSSGRILIGCEGNDGSLPYLAKRAGVESFAWASDYPHEVDLEAARRMIQETVDHAELSSVEKQAILGANARRFFKLPDYGASSVGSRSSSGGVTDSSRSTQNDRDSGKRANEG
jgi:predicted TIM-barrel fold metal-dependent hydrolase